MVLSSAKCCRNIGVYKNGYSGRRVGRVEDFQGGFNESRRECA